MAWLGPRVGQEVHCVLPSMLYRGAATGAAEQGHAQLFCIPKVGLEEEPDEWQVRHTSQGYLKVVVTLASVRHHLTDDLTSVEAEAIVWIQRHPIHLTAAVVHLIGERDHPATNKLAHLQQENAPLGWLKVDLVDHSHMGNRAAAHGCDDLGDPSSSLEEYQVAVPHLGRDFSYRGRLSHGRSFYHDFRFLLPFRRLKGYFRPRK